MLNQQEIDILFDALDAFEKSKATGKLFSTMVCLSLAKDKEQAEKIMSESEVETEDEKRRQVLAREQVILLKAKLIKTRDHYEAEQFAKSFEGHEHKREQS